MRRYQESNTGGDAEQELLNNMFNFYIEKFSDKSVDETEAHFLKSISWLVESGEISEKSVSKFLKEMGIEGNIKSTEDIREEEREADRYTRSHC